MLYLYWNGTSQYFGGSKSVEGGIDRRRGVRLLLPALNHIGSLSGSRHPDLKNCGRLTPRRNQVQACQVLAIRCCCAPVDCTCRAEPYRAQPDRRARIAAQAR